MSTGHSRRRTRSTSCTATSTRRCAWPSPAPCSWPMCAPSVHCVTAPIRGDGPKTRRVRRRRTADQAVAEAMWRRASEPAWWDQATPDQVAGVYEAALVYAGVDPDAADALVRIDTELDARYGLAVDRDERHGPLVDRRKALDRNAVNEAAAPPRRAAGRGRATGPLAARRRAPTWPARCSPRRPGRPSRPG